MLTKVGIGSLIAGIFLGLFSGISTIMGKSNMWVDMTLSKIISEEKTESIITWFDTVAIQDGLDFFFYEIPVFGLCLILGVILTVIGMFVKSH